jgi:isopenicillin N synthase-like dioxygenase
MTDAYADAIPLIDIAPLFAASSPERDAVDRAILGAAATIGFMSVTGLPATVPIGHEGRRELLRIFALPASETRLLWRQKYAPEHANIYRGWFPAIEGDATYKEGIDIGPDIAYGAAAVDAADPLRGATPLPDETALPGWRASVSRYYLALESVAAALMRSVARGLGLPEDSFDEAFRNGISTLRLIRYPPRPGGTLADPATAAHFVMHRGERRALVGQAHVDSGFVTLLAQDGVAGLQARARDGSWADVPPREGTLAVNFDKVLERWTGGRIRATEHRVLGTGRERFSIPFFYDPRPDALIAPLPLPGVAPFAPFLFGDHLWAAMMKFLEFRGMERLRPPRGVPAGSA